MQSVNNRVINIDVRLPKKSTYTAINKSKLNEKYNYELQPIRDCFDPNISSSPPNHFIELLKKRMELYYTETA
jgi:hypothetical protein